MIYTSPRWLDGKINIKRLTRTAQRKSNLLLSIDRYYSVMEKLTAEEGAMDEREAESRLQEIFHGQGLDWTQEGTAEARARWHNLKYFTWVEQQGKTLAERDAQRDPGYWEAEQKKIADVDGLIKEAREK